MSKVFVVQRNDSRMDLRPAESFGEIRFVVPKDESVFRTDDLVRIIDRGLYGYSHEDYLLPVGNPTIIGMVFAVLVERYSSDFNVLHWAARERQYVPLKFSL